MENLLYFLYIQGPLQEFGAVWAPAALTGTTKWMTVQTLFALKKGERPDVIKLNLVIDGRGTVWIDDVHLLKGPIKG